MSQLKRSFLLVLSVLLLMLQPISTVFAAPDPSADSFSFEIGNEAVIASNGDVFHSSGFGCSINPRGEVTQRPDSNDECNGERPDYYYVFRSGEEVGIIALDDANNRVFDMSLWGDALEFSPNLSENNGSNGTGRYAVYENGNQTVAPTEVQIDTSSSQGRVDFNDKCRSDVGVLAWMLCPIAEFLGDLAADFAQIIYGLLSTEPLLSGSVQSVTLKSAWNVIRNITNALLVVAFLIIIYLQLTGNQAYMVQRTLPRMVIFTILIQLSYYIAAFIVDIGNVAAAGIGDLMSSINNMILSEQLTQAQQAGLEGANPLINNTSTAGNVAQAGFQGLFYVLMGFIFYILVVITPQMAIFLLITMIIPVLFALLALSLRQMLISLFVIIAPLAMIAGIFPQTEKWMKEWFDNFIKIIMIFPLVALVFGVAGFLSTVALTTSNNSLNQIIAALIPLIALVSVPILIRLSGRAFKSVTGGIMQLSSKSNQLYKGDAGNPLSRQNQARYSVQVAKGRRYGRLLDTNPSSLKGRTLRAGPTLKGRKVSAHSFMSSSLKPSWNSSAAYLAAKKQMADVVDLTHPDMKFHSLLFGPGSFRSRNGTMNYKAEQAAKDFYHGEGRGFIMNDDNRYLATLEQFAADGAGPHPEKGWVYTLAHDDNAYQGHISPGAGKFGHKMMIDNTKGAHHYMLPLKVEQVFGMRQAAEQYNYRGGLTDLNDQFESLYITPIQELPSPEMQSIAQNVRTSTVEEMAKNLREQSPGDNFEVITAIGQDKEGLMRMLNPDLTGLDETARQSAIEKAEKTKRHLHNLISKAQTMDFTRRDMGEDAIRGINAAQQYGSDAFGDTDEQGDVVGVNGLGLSPDSLDKSVRFVATMVDLSKDQDIRNILARDNRQQ